jgi:hypothetical protein
MWVNGARAMGNDGCDGRSSMAAPTHLNAGGFSLAAAAAAAEPPPHSAAVGFWWCRRGGIGTAQQSIELGVQLGQPLVLALDLLGFFLDPLAVVPHLQDSVLGLLNSDRERVHASLVVGIASPVQRRAQVARCMTHLS